MLRVRWIIFRHTWSEKLLTAIAWRLPKKLVYWATIRLLTYAKAGEWSHEEMGQPYETALALTRWESQYLSPK